MSIVLLGNILKRDFIIAIDYLMFRMISEAIKITYEHLIASISNSTGSPQSTVDHASFPL